MPKGQDTGAFLRPLFCSPGGHLAGELGRALAAAEAAFRVPAGRMADLPLAVRDLSLLLTAERAGLSRSYWASPRFVAAYLRYFLPWNLFRLAWLLPGLDLPLKPGARILDLGSGPLTLPLALWLARPETRGLDLEIVCSDVSPKIMEHGRDIFHALAGKDSPWRISLVRTTADKAPRLVPRGSVQLVMAGNILNEMAEQQGKSGGETARRLDFFCNSLASCLSPGGRALLVEPGSRLGGSLISLCREAALDQGLTPLAPCAHAGRCPLTPSASAPHEAGQALYGRGGSSWCHFSLPARGVPAPLAALSARAGLEKDRISLSFLLLEAAGRIGEQAAGQGGERLPSLPDELDELEALYEELRAEDEGGRALPLRGHKDSEPGPFDAGPDGMERRHGRADSAAGPWEPGPGRAKAGAERGGADDDAQGMRGMRVISGPIVLPGRERAARYVCGAFGLGLLLDADDLPPGSFLRLRVELRRRDAKSGAWLIERGERAGKPSDKTENRGSGKSGSGKSGSGKSGSGKSATEGHAGAKERKSLAGKENKPDGKSGKSGAGKNRDGKAIKDGPGPKTSARKRSPKPPGKTRNSD